MKKTFVYKKELDIVAYAEFDAEFNLKEFFLVDKNVDAVTESEHKPTHNYWGNIKPDRETASTFNIYQKGNEKYISNIVTALNASHLVTDNLTDSTIPDSINFENKPLHVLVRVKYLFDDQKKSYHVENDSFEIIGLCDEKLVFSLKENESNFVHHNSTNNYENIFKTMKDSLDGAKKKTSTYDYSGEHDKESDENAQNAQVGVGVEVDETTEEDKSVLPDLATVRQRNRTAYKGRKKAALNKFPSLQSLLDDKKEKRNITYNKLYETFNKDNLFSKINLDKESKDFPENVASTTLDAYLEEIKDQNNKYIPFEELKSIVDESTDKDNQERFENIEHEYTALKEAQDVYVKILPPKQNGGRKPQNTRKKRNRKIKRVSKRNLELK